MATDNIPQRSEYLLTTYDNPFDPWTQWDEWYAWDQQAGYNTPGYLARIARTSGELSEYDQHQAIQTAIDEIVEMNVLGVHRKVARGELLNRAESSDDSVTS